MTLLKRLHLWLIPILTFLVIIAGIAIYYQRIEGYKTLEVIKWQDKVTSAFNATNYEQHGISSMAHEVAGTIQFLRLTQNTSDIARRSFLEKYLSQLVEKPRIKALDGAQIFVIDELFTVVATSIKRGPFYFPTLPDEIYQRTFDTYVKISLGEPFLSDGFIYQSDNDQVRFSFVGAYDSKLFPEDPRAQVQKERTILITDAPLTHLTTLLNDIKSVTYVNADFSLANNNNNNIVSTREIKLSQTEDSLTNRTQLSFSSSKMTLTLSIQDNHYDSEKRRIALEVFGYIVAIEAILLFVIITIMRMRILKPISHLIDDIKAGGQELRYFKRSKGDDEISVLKNAYIDTLSKVKFEAEFDYLTRLANRRTFTSHIEKRIQCYANDNAFIIGWDIKDFRKINDLYGTNIGDRVLVAVAECLRTFIHNYQADLGMGCSDYSISRYGGNCFVAVVDVNHGDKIDSFIRQFESKRGNCVVVDGYTFNLDVAIAIFPLSLSERSELWQKGLEEAFNKSKQIRSRQALVIFDKKLARQLERRDEIEKILLSCSRNGEFELEFMPLIDAKTMLIKGMEVLIRCPSLLQFNTGPDEFIRIAEQANIISSIDQWVIENAFSSYQRMRNECNYQESISINVSALELYNVMFIDLLTKASRKYQIAPQKVVIEITETSYVKSTQDTIGMVEALRDLGFKVSLDDFGTGYTSINQLLHYPVDELKIDKSFVELIGSGSGNEKMLTSIIALAHTCGASVVGEGVEDSYQSHYLSNIGCDTLQGYVFSQPLAFDDFCQLYRTYDAEHYRDQVNDVSLINKKYSPMND
ncbi:GGDEF domain-containing phosphodiesterase [Vibrio sp. ZSDZ65]|uniref:GGDEF domain-containing phosphodiesterase n=1 Tax=Vibrio qingdaonensis TaxID=2829491 RepID=A0A9X3CSG0_9VIBR|nr:GGDEF domain-containing phosphodiesterase [Vibrio qingdaonensis]MCW8348595.1 GGDEF domain-containing phosphodiesterase [Vibrio qingdaonensis]